MYLQVIASAVRTEKVSQSLKMREIILGGIEVIPDAIFLLSL